MNKNIAIILAGGKGTRMGRSGNKVLEKLCDKPIILHIIENLKELNLSKIFVVVGYDAKNVKEVLKNECDFVYQKEQLGTGHALKIACQSIKGDFDNALIINGDGPIVNTQIYKKLLDLSDCDAKILTAKNKKLSSFGRVISSMGRAFSVVEASDCDTIQRSIVEVNLGVYSYKLADLLIMINEIDNINKTGEYYATDLIELMNKYNKIVKNIQIKNNNYYIGMNDVNTLEYNDNLMQKNIKKILKNKNIRLILPNTIYISANTVVDRGATIYPNCTILGHTHIGKNCIIMPNCYINNVKIADGVCVHSGVYENKKIG